MIKEYVSKPTELARDVKQLVLSGEVNPIMVKVMYDIFSEAMNDRDVKAAIMEEVDHQDGHFEIGGFKFEKAQRTTYDYNHDSEWQRIEAQRKAREALMKLALEQEVADPQTGEIIVPPIKKTTEFIKKSR